MPANITDGTSFTDPVQTVSDGDAASAVNFALAPQGLANRTRNLKNRIDALQVNFDYATPKTNVVRRVNIAKALCALGAAQTWATSAVSEELASRANSTYLSIPIDEYLEHGATLDVVEVAVDPNAGEAVEADRMRIYVSKRTHGVSATSSDVNGAVPYTAADSSGSAQLLTMSGLAHVVDKATYAYTLHVVASVSGASSPYDKVLSASLTMSSVPGLQP